MKYEELTEGWREVGQGPAYVETDSVAEIHTGTVLPPAETKAFIRLGGDHLKNFHYGGTKKIFARKRTKNPSGIVIEDMS